MVFLHTVGPLDTFWTQLDGDILGLTQPVPSGKDRDRGARSFWLGGGGVVDEDDDQKNHR